MCSAILYTHTIGTLNIHYILLINSKLKVKTLGNVTYIPNILIDYFAIKRINMELNFFFFYIIR